MSWVDRIRAAFTPHRGPGQSRIARIIGESLDDCVRWRGVWKPGTYHKNEMVRAEEWTEIALRTTSDPPAPLPIGSPRWMTDIPGGMDTTQTLSEITSRLIVGARVTWPAALSSDTMRFFVPAGTADMLASIWAIRDPLGTPAPEVLFQDLVLTGSHEGNWTQLPIGRRFALAGDTLDLLLMIDTIETEQSFSYEWDYKRKNGAPSQGEINHQSGNNQDQMLVHQEDKDSVDRSADLDLVEAGSQITMLSSGQQWEVQDAWKDGSHYIFIVSPATRAGEASSFFTFTYYGAVSIPYVRDDDLWLTESAVSGLFSTDGIQNLQADDHGYGIDVLIQDLQISPDWDLVSVS